MSQGHLHGSGAAVAVGRGTGDVVAVAGKAVADDFGEDLGPAAFGMFQLFEDDDPRPFGHDEAVAVPVEGTAGPERLVVPDAHGLFGAESGQPQGGDRSLGAAGDHDVGVIAGDHPAGLADGVTAGGAGGDDAHIGAAGPVTDGNVPGGDVGDHHGDHHGRDPAGPLFEEEPALAGDGLQTADAARNEDSDPCRIHVPPLAVDGEPGLFHGLVRGGDGVVAKGVHPLGVFEVEVIADVEVPDLARDLSAVSARIETGYPAQSATAVDHRVPKGPDIIPGAGDHSAAGHHNTTFTHLFLTEKSS